MVPPAVCECLGGHALLGWNAFVGGSCPANLAAVLLLARPFTDTYKRTA